MCRPNSGTLPLRYYEIQRVFAYRSSDLELLYFRFVLSSRDFSAQLVEIKDLIRPYRPYKIFGRDRAAVSMNS